MPTLTINTTGAQAQRVSVAYGRLLNLRTPDKSAERDATAAEVKAEIINQIRGVVLSHERDIAAQAASDAVPDIDPT